MSEYAADRIFVPTEIVKEIAEKGETPFYLYDQQGILKSLQNLHGLFSWAEHYQNYFPVRENINPYLLTILRENGTGVCANSKTELQLAIRCGFRNDLLLYEPVKKDPDAEQIALEAGAGWFCNSTDLLPDALPNKLILRYNPCDQAFTPQIRQHVYRSQCGFNKDDLFETAVSLIAKGVKEIGLAMQISSYSLQNCFWERKAAMLFKLAAQLREKTGIIVRYCHLGEGPGLPYHPSVKAPDYEMAATLVRNLWEQIPAEERPALYTAVTGKLMEENGILITKVLEVRHILKTFLVLDAGICQYPRPVLKQAYRHISVLGNSKVEQRKTYSVVGSLPVSMDRFSAKSRILPVVNPGDYCVVHDTGCGARSMPLLYGLPCVPAEYLYCLDGSVQQISPRRSEEDVLNFLTAW